MNALREDLLRPSLDREERAATPFSVQTTFFTGFFGGPFAALAILATNSVRLRRMKRDAPLLGAMLVAILLVGWMLYHTPIGAEARAWLEAQLGPRNARIARQFVALSIVGVGYLMHRQEQSNTDLAGLQRPNGWLPGIACALGGGVLLVVYFALIKG